ncbi:hypothetical protein [Helicobacter sp. 12S02232-10]|uniref:hypothetical protein n=1 Tax=Helicobacter sp. 12S02232-10 TaxID=1476197 RepID=UPI000BA5413D|nr:hypothetical protein [Helicobacter sp. 12S02232-10]
MRKLFLCFLFLGSICLNAVEQASVSEQEESDKLEQKQEDKDFVFQPNQPSKNSYGAFRIGYVYQDLESKKIELKNGKNSYKLASNNAYFGLERGWVGGPNKMLLAGGYLDAGAGTTYYLSAGGVFALRLLDGWLIPKISIGYQLQHLSLPNDSSQYNIQSGVGTIGLFVNIVQGFGLSFEARGGIPFHIVRRDQANAYGQPKFNMYSMMISFTFYDFGI